MKYAITTPGGWRRSPFALLAWVLSALLPADLLGPQSRELVLRALLDFSRAVRAVQRAKAVPSERAIFDGLADRATAAITALGEDPRALWEETLAEPTASIDARTVARVLYVLLAERLEGELLEKTAAVLLAPDECERMAARASSIEPPEAKSPRGRRKGRG